MKLTKCKILGEIQVGIHTYKIKLCGPEEIPGDSNGYCNRASLIIYIQKDLPESVKWAAFLREVLYAIDMGLPKKVAIPLADSILAFLLVNKFPRKTIPKSVQIGPHTYSVIFSERMSGCEFIQNDLLIKIGDNLKTTELTWDYFFHECLHAMNPGLPEINIELISTLLFPIFDDLGVLREK